MDTYLGVYIYIFIYIYLFNYEHIYIYIYTNIHIYIYILYIGANCFLEKLSSSLQDALDQLDLSE